MSIIAPGIDLAKNIFAVHGVNENRHGSLPVHWCTAAPHRATRCVHR